MRRSYRFAAALLRDNWLIEASAAEAQLPLLQTLLDQARLHRDEEDGAEQARLIDPFFGCFAVQLAAEGGAPRQYKTFDEAPAGSTAVLSIDGPILKDDFCDVGMNTKAAQIRAAAAHPNIASIVLRLDTPGGQANAPALAADAIREALAAGVPVLAFVDHGMAASAGYWIAAACSEIYLSQPTDQVGSIGAYQRVRKNADSQALEVYAPQSKQKNLPQRKAAQGDTSLLEAELSDLVDEFIASVTTDRGERLAGDSDHFEGGLFMGKKAVAAGLADGICSFAAAVERVQQLAAQGEGPAGGEAAPPSFSNDTLNPSFTVKYALVCALLGATAGLAVDKEKGSYLNEAQLAALEAGFAAAATEKEQHAATNASLATATTRAEKAEADLATATTRADKAETDLKQYANLPGKEHGAVQQLGDDRQSNASAEVDPELAAVLAMKAELGIPNK